MSDDGDNYDAGVVVGVPVQAAAGAGGGGPGGWTGVSLAGDGPPTFESDAGRGAAGPGDGDAEALETEGVPAAAGGGVPWQLKLFTVGAVLYLVPSVVLLMVALMGDDRVFEAMESMRFYTVFDFCKFVAKVYFVAECTVIRTPSGERPSFRKYPLYSSFVFLVFLFDAIPVIYMLSRGEDEGEMELEHDNELMTFWRVIAFVDLVFCAMCLALLHLRWKRHREGGDGGEDSPRAFAYIAIPG